MRLVLLSVPLLLAAAPAAPNARPTNASLRKAYEQNADKVVEVWGGRRRGAGVIVGASGQIATSTDHVSLYEATVRVGDRELPAKVIAANARLKTAVLQVQLPQGTSLSAPAVRTDARLGKGTWLVGIRRGKSSGDQPKPVAGRVLVARTLKQPFITTDLPLPPGSPLFDTRGRLVAIVVEAVGRIGSRALPLGALQAQVAQETAP